MPYSKSAYAKSLGISKSELERKAREAGFSDTESYASSQGYSGAGEGGGAISTASAIANALARIAEPAAQKLEAQATPLKQRYDDLINSIKGNQQVAEQRQTLTTGNELAKRGLLSGGGLYQQEMTNALNPVTQTYTGQIQDIGNQRNVDLSNLASQVAGIRSGAATQGFTSGLGQYNTQQSLAAQIANANASNKLAQSNLALNTQNSAIDNLYKQALTQKTLQGNLGGDTWM